MCFFLLTKVYTEERVDIHGHNQQNAARMNNQPKIETCRPTQKIAVSNVIITCDRGSINYVTEKMDTCFFCVLRCVVGTITSQKSYSSVHIFALSDKRPFFSFKLVRDSPHAEKR